MKIVEPGAELISITPNAERLIEEAGRTCYKSEASIGPGTAATFIKTIIACGHESVLEHASATFRITCDRGVSHEIVRHRLTAVSQVSTRYCNYGKDRFGREISVLVPPGLTSGHLEIWTAAMRQAEGHYMMLVHGGVSAQIARSVLPNALATEVVMTANLREWRHIIRLRSSPKAHPQIRPIALEILRVLHEQCPAVFKDLWNETPVGKEIA